MRHVEDFNAAVRAGRVKAPLGSDTMPAPYPLLLIAIDDLADVLRSTQRREIQDGLLQIGTRGRGRNHRLTQGADGTSDRPRRARRGRPEGGRRRCPRTGGT